LEDQKTNPNPRLTRLFIVRWIGPLGSVRTARAHNLTRHPPEGEKDPHHRPKRGWVWNQFFVLEEHIGPEAQHVGKLHSNSDKGDGSVRYLLSGEGAGTIFTINEVTGDIHAAKSLDREKKSHYVLHARAIDRFTNKAVEPESEFIIKVQDVNDNAPTFPDGPFAAAVPEMSDIGTSVFQITATDADDPTYGNSARIVYSILQGQPYFTVDPKTGEQNQSMLPSAPCGETCEPSLSLQPLYLQTDCRLWKSLCCLFLVL
uniref:Cadherin domain-containing protein n=1 Tax=Astyanax mexicanus TaxID=7994 RepID=A0A3B1IGZ6_ASTMX